MKFLEKIKKKKQESQKGMAALFAVVAVGGAGFLVAYASSFLSIGEAQMSFDDVNSSRVFFIAESCAEEALERLRTDQTFAGGSLAFDDGACSVTVGDSGSGKIIQATGNFGEYYKTITIEVSLGSRFLEITSWEVS